MTIIKYSKSLKYYPHNYIQREVVIQLLTEITSKNSYIRPKMLVKMFEAICDLTDNRISTLNLQHSSFAELTYSFLGGLFSGEIITLKEDALINNIDAFYIAAANISKNIIRDDQFDNPTNRRKFLNENKPKFISYWKETKKSINKNRLKYWCGFSIKGRKGEVNYLELQGVYENISPKLALLCYKQISEETLKRTRPDVTVYNNFFNYLAKNNDKYNISTFIDSRSIDILFKNYCKDYFLIELKEKKRNIHSVTSNWNMFIGRVTDTFLKPGIWKKPISGRLPHIINQGTNSKKTNIKKNHDGIEVKKKLLTDIPIQITDQEAIKLLFGNIESDLKTIESWAISQAKDLYDRYQNRKKFSLKGTVFSSIQKDFGRKSPEYQELIHHLAATYEAQGHENGFSFRFQSKITCRDIMHTLGIPKNSHDLAPYKFLLTIYHPEITPTYLRDLELYDKRGNLVGFVEIDGVYWLTGYKDRKTPAHAEQRIKLRENSAKLIKELIEITESVRLALKNENNDLWRFLFINYSNGMKKKIKSSNITYNKSQKDRNISSYINFSNQIQEFTDKRGEKLDQFIWNVSLSTIRASSAILVYLNTYDIQEMSRALGHTNATKDKLREYLPEPIFAFFQSRWIRLFQKAIICEAMKESEYILNATKFQTIDELHIFLMNHALNNKSTFYNKEKKSPNIKNKLESNSHVYFSVDQGILVTLLSLEHAVKSSSKNRPISGYAKYWSKVSELITNEINRCNDRNLKTILIKAEKNIKPELMGDLIYANSI